MHATEMFMFDPRSLATYTQTIKHTTYKGQKLDVCSLGMAPPAQMRALVEASVDMWAAYAQTLQCGLEPTAFCACTRSSTPLLKMLGRVTRPLRRSIVDDVGVIEAAMATAPAATTLSSLAPEHTHNQDIVNAIVWCHRGLAFASAAARAMADDPATSTTTVVRAAYDATLAPHHGKSMATVFRRAADLMPNRDKVRRRVAGGDVDALLGSWADVVEPCLLHLSIMCAEREWVVGPSARDADAALLDVDGDSD